MQKIQFSDYAKYLACGLKVKYKSDGADYMLRLPNEKVLGNSREVAFFINEWEEYKPYLRPISQMAEQIMHNGKTFVPFEELAKLTGITLFSNSANTKSIWVLAPYRKDKNGEFDFFKFDGNIFTFLIQGDDREVEVTCENQDKLKEWCYEHHFWLGDQNLFKTGEILELKS